MDIVVQKGQQPFLQFATVCLSLALDCKIGNKEAEVYGQWPQFC